MIVKAVTFFLIGIAVLAMFGKLRLRLPGGRRAKPGQPPKPRKCPDCGAYLIGKGPCACKSG